MLRVLIRLLADEVFVAVLLFVSAGTTDWPRAWILLAVLLLVRTIGAADDAVRGVAAGPNELRRPGFS
jgi:hypothetical protein